MKRFFTLLFPVMLLIGVMLGSLPPAMGADLAAIPSIIVKTTAGLSAAEQGAIIERNGGIETSAIPALRMHVIKVPSGDPVLILQKYQSDPQVERAELDGTRRAEAIPNDPEYGLQWELGRIGWDALYGTVTPKGSATVAVLDTGVDASHPDLYDAVIDGTSILDGSNGLADPSGHGTWLAGIVAAVTNNTTGIAGVAFQGVRILPVTVLSSEGTGRDSDIIAGIIWAADHGADVILMGFSNPDFSQNLQDAIDYAWSKGAVLVAAAGNNGTSVPAFPAGNRGVVGVSATDQDDTLLYSSNFGQSIFLAAPGASIDTTDLNGSYVTINGTSASSAIVAGVAAFLKASDPSLTNGLIVGRLATSADPVGIPEDPVTPTYYGNGRVNIAGAFAATSTEFIQPAGAAPIGEGGPYIGPYTIAADRTVKEITCGTQQGALTEGTAGSAIYSVNVRAGNGAPNQATLSVTGLPAGATSAFSVNPLALANGTETVTLTITTTAGTPAGTSTLTIRNSSSSVTGTATLVIAPAMLAQNIVVDLPAPVSAPYLSSFSVAAHATSGLEVNITANGSCSGSGAGNATITMNGGTGNCTVYYDQAGNATFAAATQVTSQTVAQKAVAAIALMNLSQTYNGGLRYPAVSTDPVGLAVVWTNAPQQDAGSYPVTATVQDPNYQGSASGTFTVTQADPGVTGWPLASAIEVGQTVGESTLSGGTAAVPGSFAFASPAIVPDAVIYHAAVTFTPVDDNYHAVNGQADILVNVPGPGPVDHFAISLTGTPATAGTPFGMTITALDLSNNTVTSFVGAVQLTTTAGTITPATTAAFVDGVWSGTVTVTGAGAGKIVTAVDPVSGKTVTTESFEVTPGPVVGFGWTVPSSVTAGIPFDVTVAAYDQYQNVATNYLGTVHFSSTDPMTGIALPGDYTFLAQDAGVKTFTGIVLQSAGDQTITATDMANSVSGFSGTISVNPAAAASLTVTTPVSSGAGTPFDMSVTVKDVFGNIIESYEGTIAFSSSDPNAALPSAYTFVPGDRGKHTFTGALLKTAGIHTVTATDTGDAGIAAASGSISVSSGPAYKLAFSQLPAAPVAEKTLTPAVAVTVLDQFDNPIAASTALVTLALGSASPSGILGGTTSVAAVGGVATFADLSIDSAGAGYALVATSQDLVAATSASFAVEAGTPPACSAPGWINATADSAGNVAVRWGASETAGVTYVVERGLVSVDGQVTYDEVNVLTTTDLFIYEVIQASGTYVYRVKATSEGYGDSSWTNMTGGCVVTLKCGAPATLNVPAANSTGLVTITWSPSDVVGVTYVLEQKQGADGAWVPVYTGKDTLANVAVSASGSYSYRIKATKANYQDSGYTNAGTACSVELKCAAPVTLNVPAANSTGIINITWSPSDVAGVTYILEQKQGTDSAWVPVYTGKDTLANVAVSLSGSYSYRVKATKTNYQDSGYTNGGTICAVDLKCGAPATLTVPTNNSTGIINITWSPSDVVGVTYILEQKQGTDGAWAPVYTGKDTLANVTVSLSGSYSYRIKATKANYQDSGYTNAGTACSVELKCGAPVTLNVPAANSTGIINITWSPSDVAGVTYILEQKQGTDGAWVQVYTGKDTLANVTVSLSGSYSYRVKATKANYQDSGYTNGSAACSVELKCGAPVTLNVPAANSTGIINITWSPSDVVGVTYILEQKQGTDGAWVPVYTGKDTLANVAVTLSGSYSYRIKAAKTNYQDSGYTNGGMSCAVDLKCGAPANLTVPANNSTGIINITWSPSDVAGVTYILEQQQGTGTWVPVYTGKDTLANVAVSASGSYSYRIKATKTNYQDSGYTNGAAACSVDLKCGAPATLNVPAANSTGIVPITWSPSDVAGVTYIIEQKQGTDGAWIPVYTGKDTLANVAVSMSGSYSYRIKATKTNYQDSGHTNGAAACSIDLKCGAPATLTVPSANSTGIITITWSPSDVAGVTYILEQKQGTDGAWVPVYTGKDTLANVAVTLSGSYSYRIKATKTNYQDSSYTNGAAVCSVDLKCGAPATLTVPAANTTGIINITWSPSDVAGVTYLLEQKQGTDGAWVPVYTGKETLANVAVTVSGSYSYRIKATKTSYQDSSYTNGAAACSVELKCGAPATLNVPATNTTGIVRITWSPSDVAGVTYGLEQSNDGGATYTTVYSGTDTLANVAVNLSGSYSYRVKATKANYQDSGYTNGGRTCGVTLTCGAPGSLTVPAGNTTGIIPIIWTPSDVAGVTYVLEQSNDGGATYTTVYSGTDTVAKITVPLSGTYSYRVKATKTNYIPSATTEAANNCAVTLTCGAPNKLTVPAANTTGIIPITWSPSDVTGVTYILEQKLGQDGAWVQVYSGKDTLANVAVNISGTYSYRVSATKTDYIPSGTTEGANSCAVTLTCGAPVKLTVPVTNTTGIILITWSPSDVAGVTYVLEQQLGQDGAWVEVYSGKDTLANVAVSISGTYSYRVSATKTNYTPSGTTNGANSCGVTLTCGAPAKLTVPANNTTGIIPITWSPSDVAGVTYVLEQQGPDGNWVQVYSGKDTLANVTVTISGSYTYRIKATKANYSASETTAGSNPSGVTLACGAPVGLKVPSANTTGLVSITWSPGDVAGVTYVLEQKKDDGAYIVVYSGTDTRAIVAVVSNGTYTYRVKATKAEYQESGWAVGNSGCVVELRCGPPTSLTIPATSTTGVINITWGPSDVAGATYIIEQSKNGGEFVQVYSGPETWRNITVTENGYYTFRVRSTKGGDYLPSDWVYGTSVLDVAIAQTVKIGNASQSDMLFRTLADAIGSLPAGESLLTTWNITFVENLYLAKGDAVLTVGSAYNPNFTLETGPTVIQGTVTVAEGTLIAENLVIR